MHMKTSSAAAPLSRTAARNCILINQLATPGLGSVMAGRRMVGFGQLLLAVTGFALVCGWFILTVLNTYNGLKNDIEPRPVGWVGGCGGLVFFAAWVWALFTSFQIHRSFKTAAPGEVPPRLN